MLVYANHLSFEGVGAQEAIFKAIGGWLKEQLGFGLHPDQLGQDGEFNGDRGDARSWLRIYATSEEEPGLYAWVLKNLDASVRGRQWVTELGFKAYQGTIELSCVVKAEEQSTLVATRPTASCPRVISYIVNNIQKSAEAEFGKSLEALEVRPVGADDNSYRTLLAEIEREDRDCPIVLVSPSRDGEYLVDPVELQRKLIGLGQVVHVASGFNSYQMAEILGRHRSAWNGAVNVLRIPSKKGLVYTHLFLSAEIEGWGNTPNDRVSQLLAHVTDQTNVRRLRAHVRPEGVIQLALRRRLQSLRARSEQMDSAQLRAELDKAVLAQSNQQEWIDTVERSNTELESELADAKEDNDVVRKALKKQQFDNDTLKQHLANAGSQQTISTDLENLLILACPGEPTPSKCLEVIEELYSN